MEKIASNISSTFAAVSGVKSVSVGKGEEVSIEKSNVSSMKSGEEVNNQLLPNLVDLVECVQAQSEKFPKIAEMMALKDNQIKF
ncbi:hypothetical protein HCJ28_08175 [Listeria sp. FSL L7-1434]|uniref:hypothetical protein n=1 Tax=Listeria cossartiae TaxID=2838249 RepID=UPI001625694C|nr:hypothetical protein [Listeria cossartiae]MBC1549922.1 hypothetical protein [Listeria cossartiae subsp. cossartiae]